jgi:O-antigen/teichoic acid export membrane protein
VTNRVATRLQILRHWITLVLGQSAPITHGERRYTRLFQTILTSFLGKGLTILVGLITVPLTIGYLGTERYGLWVTISTLLIWLQLADLGLGNGLTNALAEAYGSDRDNFAQQYVATAFWALCVVSLLLGVVAVWAVPQLGWATLLQVSSAEASREFTTALVVALIITCLSVPLTVVDKIFAAYQEGAIANGWAAVGSIVSLLALLLVIQANGGLAELVWAFSGSLLLVKALSGIWLFGRRKPWLAPLLSKFSLGHLRRLMVVGVEFFIFQIAALVLFQSDNLVIAHFLGPDYVAEYNVVYRLFAQLTMVQMLVLAPLWPAYGEAATRQDWFWIRRAFRQTLIINFLLFGTAILIVGILGRPLVQIWTAGVIQADSTLILLVAIWSLMVVWGNSFSMLLNGLGIVRPQALLSVLMAAINLALSILWVQQFGANGVMLATIVAYSVTSLWAAPIIAYRALQKERAF